MGRAKPPRNTFWRGDILWGRVKIKGQTLRWSLRTGHVETARRRVDEEIRRLKAEEHFGEVRRSYEDVFSEWAKHISAQVAPATAKRYAVSLKQLSPTLRPLWIDEIDRKLIAGIIKSRRAAGTTNTTIRPDLTALSSVLDFAESQGWCETNPALAALRHLRERRDPIILPRDTDIAFVLTRMPAGFAALARAALLTGCRQDELVTADRRRLDRARRQLTVIGKGNKLRVVQLSDEAFRVLAGLPVSLATTAMFWHSDGEPFRNVSSRFRGYVAGAQKVSQEEGLDFQRFRFHDLRHRYAVDYLKNGGNIYLLQKQLGHSSVKTTEIYLDHLTPEEARNAIYGDGAVSQKGSQRRRSDGAAIGKTVGDTTA